MARNDEEWRKLAVSYSLEQFKKHGIHDVTMDSIAKGLGMSKRTLYKMFGDKSTLVEECLNCWLHDQLDTQSRARVLSDRLRDVDTDSSLRKLLTMLHKFIQELYLMSDTFLRELHEEPKWSIFERYYVKVWSDEVMRLANRCVSEHIIPQQCETGLNCDKALSMLTRLRREGETKKTVWQICFVNLRGLTAHTSRLSHKKSII